MRQARLPAATARALCVLVAALLVLVGIGPVARAAASAPEAAYWWAGATAPGATPTDVPAGGLYVSTVAAGPTAESAVRVRASHATADARLVLRVHGIHVGDAMTLVLLPTTTSWSAGSAQPWDGKPGYDQQLPPSIGTLAPDQSIVTFSLGSMSSGETRSLLLLPTRAYSTQPGFSPDAPWQSFDISFEPPTASSLELGPGGPVQVRPSSTPRRPAHRPGPDLLYAPEARAPQLQNRPGGPWRASPLLVSGADAYRSGEYLYQGFLYDDHGAAGAVDPGDPIIQKFLFGAKAGTLTYPTDKVFANNAADVLEFRVKPLADATAVRVTFTSLLDPKRTAFTVALGTSATSRSWPSQAGVSSPAQLFVTVHGSTADVVDAATGAHAAGHATVTVDLLRHQYDVRIPHAAWDPGTSKQRIAVGAGLWDVAAGHYLAPTTAATATSPGGAAPSQAALFDLGFRFAETMPNWQTMGLSYTIVDSAVVVQADQKCFWRDCQQAAALRTGDISAFHADVDFGRLRRGVTDDSHVPTSGYIDRIHASRLSFGQGIDPAQSCGRFPVKCHGMFIGNLQPYQVYVPPRKAPPHGWALTVMLHASGANHNERMGSRMEQQLGGRAAGSIVMTALARDPNGDYTDANEAEVFESWADVARHYPLDTTRTVVVGYSMGGGGTYKMSQRWPDLFAAGFGAAAVPFDDGWQGQWFPGMLNVPMLTWIGSLDEGSGNNVQLIQIHDMEQYGYRFELRQFPAADHLTIATNDQYADGVTWLGDRRVVRDPPRVSFAVDTRLDFRQTSVVADHAYWLSGITVRDRQHDPAGAVEAHSLGFGAPDPTVVDRSTTPGLLTGGYHGPMAYVKTAQDWHQAGATATSDHLDLELRNVGAVEVDLTRARLDCHATVSVHTDGPTRVSFPQCGSVASVRRGTTSLALLPTSRSNTPVTAVGALPATGAGPLAWLAVILLALGGSLRRQHLRRG
ncbi:MAG: putative penicillin acylase [Frankiales bacterium]|nr:putative penicillin acylase [Frankiales bacterium]